LLELALWLTQEISHTVNRAARRSAPWRTTRGKTPNGES
jgi:hypothetical protein